MIESGFRPTDHMGGVLGQSTGDLAGRKLHVMDSAWRPEALHAWRGALGDDLHNMHDVFVCVKLERPVLDHLKNDRKERLEQGNELKMYSESIQSSPLVIFSSLPISSPFRSTSISIDPNLVEDSLICLLDDHTSLPIHHSTYTSNQSQDEKTVKILGSDDSLQSIRSIVLHLQSPNCLSTFIQFPSPSQAQRLGIKLPFLHFQIKFINHQFLFEIETQDDSFNLLRIRCSTFQKKPKFYSANLSNRIPLLHLPIHLPNSSMSSKQTNWSELLIPIKSITETYSQSKFGSINSIKVHSNCRLRRIYCSSDGKGFGLGDRRRDSNQMVYDHKFDRMVLSSGSNHHRSDQINQIKSNERIELMLFKSSNPNTTTTT
ncbi:uncharacterized protein MELLADRAFT_101710 [Melampsora larici-populina 98AG31]|uniref:CFA20 domain-containing protein n=1 Tax=Melampsora larici-populina (strain 98AG31 / pathotype 3-4-7) TaxID=747676 RepID=F4R6Q3_MELLP|nr:uncharacterized protein MELLADRAFT_101710 [Melampsora larici-populina 98AG31]EGG11918.1 hypothetical protein MELLADRAFT_101710 [Melampsora larici-populina 98AG31]